MERNKVIVRTSIVGIVVNVILVGFKAAVGFIAGSISVILDAVNNLGDALSSIITIVGTKLAGRRPDKKHPYGYGRVEYLTAAVVAVIVLLAGVTSLRESVEKILEPEAPNYSIVSLVIIAVGVVVKFLTGRYVKSVGQRINAQSLVASGSDAFFDSILSFATLIGAALSLFWGLNLEGWLGTLISVFILKAGVEMLLEPLNAIIGTRADPELSEKLKEAVNSFPEVRGAYDLTLHNYGPTEIIGSVHVEVPDDMTAREIHRLTREISLKVYRELSIILTVGVYASNSGGEELSQLRGTLEETLSQYPQVLQMHGFYVDSEQKLITFDLVVDFDADGRQTAADVCAAMKARYPEYTFAAILDTDYSD